jgi:hypothetical protein
MHVEFHGSLCLENRYIMLRELVRSSAIIHLVQFVLVCVRVLHSTGHSLGSECYHIHRLETNEEQDQTRSTDGFKSEENRHGKTNSEK